MPEVDMTLRLILIIIGVCVSGFIIYRVKKEIIELKYTIIWLIVALGLLILSFFPQIATIIAKFLHIGLPINAIVFLSILFLSLLNLTLSTTVSKLYIKIVRLTQEIGILKTEIDTLKKDLEILKMRNETREN